MERKHSIMDRLKADQLMRQVRMSVYSGDLLSTVRPALGPRTAEGKTRQTGITRTTRRSRLKKVKFSHTRYRVLGPELIPVYRQSKRR